MGRDFSDIPGVLAQRHYLWETPEFSIYSEDIEKAARYDLRIGCALKFSKQPYMRDAISSLNKFGKTLGKYIAQENLIIIAEGRKVVCVSAPNFLCIKVK